jgi:hypothetical protein
MNRSRGTKTWPGTVKYRRPSLQTPGARLNKAETGRVSGGMRIMNGWEEKDDNEGRGRNDGRRKHLEPRGVGSVFTQYDTTQSDLCSMHDIPAELMCTY